MAFTEKSLARQAVSDTAETVFTATTTTIVKDIHIANNGSSDCYVSVWLVPDGDSADDENIFLYQWNIPANYFGHWNGWQVLSDGDTIVAQSETADQITIHIAGAEI